MRITEIINSIPEFMWNNIFSVISTLGCGLIVAFFTSTFLKKKEERTRIAGVIVEKRTNSEQEILHFLESELFKQEINMDNSSKDDYLFDELLKQFELPVPYDGHMQYARVFTNPKLFEDFFHKFEEQIMNHKLWLDTKVKEHLVFMQIYFLFFNTIPLMIKRIPLKVEDSIQYTTRERDNVVSENNLVIHSNVKVENDDQSKLVFGQPGGITYLFKYVIPLEEKRCA